MCAIDRFQTGENMKNTIVTAAMAAVFASVALASATAHAQSKPLAVWQPAPEGEKDPAKRVPTTSVPTDAVSAQSLAHPQASSAVQQSYAAAAPSATMEEESRGGVFLGVQGGKGWVYDDVDQSARAVNAGYRWQAGAVSLVGIELAAGRLDDAEDDGFRYGKVDYSSVGVNARFNFGRDNPVYGLVRAGYWAADIGAFDDTVDGGYFGLGVGVDFNRHFNMSLVYTNHVYFNEYAWTDDGFEYDASRADLLMLGAEVRF
ncbi:outer membrane beta-barrel protein [Novilysobacter ciconiae]|nr:outer membrane beta-barrel protein [Lysobacter ciconiae]